MFASVLTVAKPRVAPDLFRYQNYIILASRQFQPHAWLQYDIQFRLKKASNPGMSWSTADPELTATWLSADAVLPKINCYLCGSPDHLAPVCPTNMAGKSAGLRCPVCNGDGHVARSCPTLASTSQKQQKPPPPSDHKPSMTTKFAAFLIKREVVFEAQDAHTSMYVTSAKEATQSRPALIALNPTPINQHKICTPLRPQIFARLLHNHPDQAFVSKLITSLQSGFDIGYSGPHSPLVAPNLHSSSVYPHIVDEALDKEIQANLIAGPYLLPPPSITVLELYQKKMAVGTS